MLSAPHSLRCSVHYCGFDGGRYFEVVLHEDRIELENNGERVLLPGKDWCPATLEGKGHEMADLTMNLCHHTWMNSADMEPLRHLWDEWRAGADRDGLQRALADLLMQWVLDVEAYRASPHHKHRSRDTNTSASSPA